MNDELENQTETYNDHHYVYAESMKWEEVYEGIIVCKNTGDENTRYEIIVIDHLDQYPWNKSRADLYLVRHADGRFERELLKSECIVSYLISYAITHYLEVLLKCRIDKSYERSHKDGCENIVD